MESSEYIRWQSSRDSIYLTPCSKALQIAAAGNARTHVNDPTKISGGRLVELSSGSLVHTSRKSADGSIHVYADPGLKDARLRRYSRSSSESTF
jgi:hypothetical protein